MSLVEFFIYWFVVVVVVLIGLVVMFLFNLNVVFSFVSVDLCMLFFVFSQYKVVFWVLLMLIVLSVVIYSCYYMSDDLNYGYFVFVTMIFVVSMVGVVFSGGCISMFIFWDLLGISSFFLVLYYGNWDSCSGAMNTVMMNRIGDAGVYLVFSGIFINGFGFISSEGLLSWALFFFVVGCMTKSAQLPFSSWLPKAMSAPTPVSALVHSSTLVTAGLFLMMSLSSLVYLFSFLSWMFYLGLLTMLVAGLSAYFEVDIKKLVALSTLSQMGFCFISMGMGLVFLSFVHIMSHAIFKSCLFMQIGGVIHVRSGQQDTRSFCLVGGDSMVGQLQVFIMLMNLCGLMFLSGAVSKEVILENFLFSSWNMVVVFVFFVSVLLTYLYSYRMMSFFYYSFGLSNYYIGGSLIKMSSSFILVVFSLVFVSWLSSNMCSFCTKLLYIDFYGVFYLFLFGSSLCYVVFKGVFSEVKYKFVLDYIVKWGVGLSSSFVWLESVLGLLMMNLFVCMNYVSKLVVMVMGSLGLNAFVIVAVMVLFML
uniref:NADH:ubiquinone reductase (H(+)-translocating) n=1 Tax=Clavinema parasiluri TaxID=332280 RepID=A0A9F2HGX7_9BILA|nr:NADH dehydrogenase subunit 5 [Clavinema parasiluri]WAX01694.1 NADH dehydrogenase subunit 5 [Clavinema parasiluri]